MKTRYVKIKLLRQFAKYVWKDKVFIAVTVLLFSSTFISLLTGGDGEAPIGTLAVIVGMWFLAQIPERYRNRPPDLEEAFDVFWGILCLVVGVWLLTN